MANPTYLDRAIGALAPAWQLKRERSRLALQGLRHYEAAAGGRRTSGWNRSRGDANAVTGPAVGKVRATARDAVRNNAYASSWALTVVANTIGWGAKPRLTNPAAQAAFDVWADATNFYALQQQALRSVAVDGEVLVRRFISQPDESGILPVRLQLLEADFIDTDRNPLPTNGSRIVNGVEIDERGEPVAYWLFREHPGSQFSTMPVSERVPASEILHIYRKDRPGQLRGVSWLAPVLLRLKDLDDYEDAALMKAKVSACLSVMVTDPDGSGSPLGMATGDNGEIDSLEPGMVVNLASGKTVSVVQPPQNADYDPYTKNVLRSIATGLGITYEDLTGDYSQTNFSSARMSRLRHWALVESWRWAMLVPQFLDPVAAWVMQAARIAGVVQGEVSVAWSFPPMAMIEPDREGIAIQRLIRTGVMTLSEALRERGYDPASHLAEMAADNAKLDELGLVLDSDPRKMTAQGQAQTAQSPAQPPTDESE